MMAGYIKHIIEGAAAAALITTTAVTVYRSEKFENFIRFVRSVIAEGYKMAFVRLKERKKKGAKK
ncbi:MAG: hypothetical protein NT136_04110 [Candidatus Moranbacteria bacterium]|nr:hypothetical protein [Candidatus Moranbacteria bacterium]